MIATPPTVEEVIGCTEQAYWFSPNWPSGYGRVDINIHSLGDRKPVIFETHPYNGHYARLREQIAFIAGLTPPRVIEVPMAEMRALLAALIPHLPEHCVSREVLATLARLP